MCDFAASSLLAMHRSPARARSWRQHMDYPLEHACGPIGHAGANGGRSTRPPRHRRPPQLEQLEPLLLRAHRPRTQSPTVELQYTMHREQQRIRLRP